jgi:hypothetical protein
VEESVDQDDLSKSMQDEVIKIASMRLGKSLPEELVSKVRQRKWGYMGLGNDYRYCTDH